MRNQPGTLGHLTTRDLIHIPGPNPILIPGTDDEWDSGMIECCNILKDGNTYYLFYHGLQASERARYIYRIGVATASHPLGPWRKYEGNPVIDLGPEGAWDGPGSFVACAMIIKEREGEFYLLYNGGMQNHTSDVGLAYADNPLGPWRKYEGNPVAEGLGYIGGVVKRDGRYSLFSENPIGASSPDQGPMVLAVADKLEGPWLKHPGNPVLEPDGWGSWDDGGYSEAGVLYHDDAYHMFYGGTKWEKLESIGYACSLDRQSFVKHVDNPVVPRENYPDASAFAEVHALWEPPFYYLFNTLRYKSRKGFEEDLGVQILAAKRPFAISMPVLAVSDLRPGECSRLDHEAANGYGKTLAINGCSPIGMDSIRAFSIAIKCTCASVAKLRVRLLSSSDGLNYDTHDWYSYEIGLHAGRNQHTSKTCTADVRYMKVILENISGDVDLQGITAHVTLHG